VFLGTHFPKLDDKGRLFLPAKFRDELADGLVITRGQERSLSVWPEREFVQLTEQLKQAPITNKGARDYLRMLFAGASNEMPDKQGRVTIPPMLRDYAGLDRDRVVIGARNRVEIWNTENWNRYSRVGTRNSSLTIATRPVTAWNTLVVSGKVKEGDTVLTLGTGGVSVFALQFAKMAGATVIATSSTDEKLGRLEALGADYLINYRKDENWGDSARRLTGGRGVDHVIEVGGPASLAQSLVAARVGGHVAVIGILSGTTATLPLHTVLTRQLRLKGLVVGSRRWQMDMIRAIDATGLRPVIDRHAGPGPAQGDCRGAADSEAGPGN